MQKRIKDRKNNTEAKAFNVIFRYINDVFSINNSQVANWISLILYSLESEKTNTTSSNFTQVVIFLPESNTNKFVITHCPTFDSYYIIGSGESLVYISQIIHYDRACSCMCLYFLQLHFLLGKELFFKQSSYLIFQRVFFSQRSQHLE